jgi:hypothetical protein
MEAVSVARTSLDNGKESESMIGVRTHSSMARRTVLGFVLVFGTIVGGSHTLRTEAASASSHSAAVTTTDVAYHLAAQVVSGPGSASIQGQVAGTLDSTGLLTATLTLANGLTGKVTGTVAGPAKLTIKGKAANLTLSGKALNKMAGTWGGTVATGASANAGSWVLTPETVAVTFSLGGKSSMGSKDKLALAGQLSLMLTADGWGEGTFSFLANDTVLPAEGRVSNGNITATVFWPKKGAVLLVATGQTVVGVFKWTGSFVGPAQNDFGTFVGEG